MKINTNSYITNYSIIQKQKNRKDIQKYSLNINFGKNISIDPKKLRGYYLAKCKIQPEYVKYFSKLSNSQFEEAKKNLIKGYTPVDSALMARLNNDQLKIYTTLSEEKIEPDIAFLISKTEKDVQQRCMELIKIGINAHNVLEIANLDKQQREKINTLIKLGISDINIADFAKLTKEQYKKAIDLLKQGVISDYIIDILRIEEGNSKNRYYKKYIDMGYSKNSALSLSLMSLKEQKEVHNIISKNEEAKKLLFKNYEVIYTTIQNSNPEEKILIFNKETQIDNGTKIILVQILGEDGILSQSRLEEYKDHSTSSKLKGISDLYQIKYGKYGDIKELTQFICNRNNGNVIGVIHSKESKNLDGCFESVYYDITDFQESSEDAELINPDIEQAVRNQGKIISKTTKNKDGSISFQENFKWNHHITSREYNEKKDRNGNIISNRYSYIIKKCSNDTENQEKEIMNISREFIRNPDGSVKNVINGNEYKLSYDNENKSICIESEDMKKILNFKNKLPIYSQESLWKVIKNLSADVLIDIDRNINKWYYCKDMDSYSSGINKTMATGKNIPIILHETGHLLQEDIANNDTEFYKLYEKEMNLFYEKIPYNEQEFIEYFSPLANLCESDGIYEFIAEVHMILCTYGASETEIKTRSQFLVRYFPQTIARLAKLMGKTSKRNLLE